MTRILVYDLPKYTPDATLYFVREQLIEVVSTLLNCQKSLVKVTFQTDRYPSDEPDVFVELHTDMLMDVTNDVMQDVTGAVAERLKVLLFLEGEVRCAVVHMDMYSVYIAQ